MMFIDPAMVGVQAVSEHTGAAVTTAMLGGATPELLSPAPMGADEGTAMFAAGLAAHGAEFLAVTGLGAVQRELLGATGTASVIEYTAMEAANVAGLTA